MGNGVERSTVQAILAVLIVAGVLLLLAFGREGRVPGEALWSLVGLVVGYYFGAASSSSSRNGEGP